MPLAVEGNAPIVTLQFRQPDGQFRKARFVFDSGGGALIFDESLAKDLGLKHAGAIVAEGDSRYACNDSAAHPVGRNVAQF